MSTSERPSSALRRGLPHDEQALVARSIKRYARSHRGYERRHPEIFNPIEQDRLRRALGDAIELARPDAAASVTALDLGCGTGNLTAHLVALGARVTAADVSPEFLEIVAQRFGPESDVRTLQVNGVDLAEIEDGTFDLAAVYSVLHHVPDYLAIVEHLARVVKPGGIVYVDHEVNESYWQPDGCVERFRAALRETARAHPKRWDPDARRWQRYLIPARYVRKLKWLVNPDLLWGMEGDIHVFQEDHIDWEQIEQRLVDSGCEIVRTDDYLVFQSDYPTSVYERFKDSCSDMRLVMARVRRSVS
jgi:SAM-dependent methyltransferase